MQRPAARGVPLWVRVRNHGQTSASSPKRTSLWLDGGGSSGLQFVKDPLTDQRRNAAAWPKSIARSSNSLLIPAIRIAFLCSSAEVTAESSVLSAQRQARRPRES